jgi:hypothetical protein
LGIIITDQETERIEPVLASSFSTTNAERGSASSILEKEVDHLIDTHIALPVPLELTPSVIARGKIEVARNYLRITEGEIHRHGSFWRIPFCLATNLEIARYAVIDTGAMPTICKADALRQLDSDFESKLITIPLKSLSGLQGWAEIMGVYVTSLLLPHAEHPLLLE